MPKTLITRLFIGAGLAIVAGAVLAIVAVSLAIASDTFVMNGPDIVGLRGSPPAWVALGLGVLGAVAMAGGLLAGLVAWIGALLNTWHLPSRAWFVGLLLLGIFNLGFFAMLAYLLAGPDSTSRIIRPTTAPVPA